MSCAAPVNKILPYSVVDGPGNRCAIFLQGCNLHCAYCHNPETQQLCAHCGKCVPGCPAGALTLEEGRVVWDAAKCVSCDRCLQACPNHSSPKVRWMTPEAVMAEVRKSMPFIRGISTSGGECGLYPDFLTELYRMARAEGLTCLMDHNGAVDLSLYPELLEAMDGVMLDVKSWQPEVFRKLTGGDVSIVQKNLRLLGELDKLEELRIVTLPGHVDAENCLEGIARTLGETRTARQTLKLIRFRPFGVRGALEKALPPPLEYMERLADRARALGFNDIRII